MSVAFGIVNNMKKAPKYQHKFRSAVQINCNFLHNIEKPQYHYLFLFQQNIVQYSLHSVMNLRIIFTQCRKQLHTQLILYKSSLYVIICFSSSFFFRMKVKMSYGLLLAEEICSLLYPWSVKIDNGSGTRKHGFFWVSFAKMLANFIIIFQSNSPKVSRIYEKKKSLLHAKN